MRWITARNGVWERTLAKKEPFSSEPYLTYYYYYYYYFSNSAKSKGEMRYVWVDKEQVYVWIVQVGALDVLLCLRIFCPNGNEISQVDHKQTKYVWVIQSITGGGRIFIHSLLSHLELCKTNRCVKKRWEISGGRRCF